MQNQQYPLIIISGPSGAGEDSIIGGLKELLPIERVVTTTTREMRPSESAGNPYYFISKEKFKEGIAEGRFFEYAEEYNDNFYGVTFEEIKRVKNSGRIGIWKIEYKGVMLAKKLMPEIAAIFIIAPLDILEKRIRRRSWVSDEYVQERMEYTKKWLEHTDIYDYTVVNEDGKLAETIREVKRIIEKELSKNLELTNN
ncbi:MAG: hypothetical protein WC862_02180 [Patescibacteria group bacterium]